MYSLDDSSLHQSTAASDMYVHFVTLLNFEDGPAKWDYLVTCTLLRTTQHSWNGVLLVCSFHFCFWLDSERITLRASGSELQAEGRRTAGRGWLSPGRTAGSTTAFQESIPKAAREEDPPLLTCQLQRACLLLPWCFDTKIVQKFSVLKNPQQTCTPSTGGGKRRIEEGKRGSAGSRRRTQRGRGRMNYRLPVFVLRLQLAPAIPFDQDQRVNISVQRSDQGAGGGWRGEGMKVWKAVTTRLRFRQHQNDGKRRRKWAAKWLQQWKTGGRCETVVLQSRSVSLFLQFPDGQRPTSNDDQSKVTSNCAAQRINQKFVLKTTGESLNKRTKWLALKGCVAQCGCSWGHEWKEDSWTGEPELKPRQRDHFQ